VLSGAGAGLAGSVGGGRDTGSSVLRVDQVEQEHVRAYQSRSRTGKLSSESPEQSTGGMEVCDGAGQICADALCAGAIHARLCYVV
jgi:hypothetical protein